MVLVRETQPRDWQALRDIRLAALRDAPDAFASTHDREAAFTEHDWCDRIAKGGTFLAYLPEVSPAGLIGGYRIAPGVIELVSMYVRPWARGRGVGEALIDALIGWAWAQKAGSVHLWVNETNSRARLLYERYGFAPTGERQPLPSNLALTEIGMTRPL